MLEQVREASALARLDPEADTVELLDVDRPALAVRYQHDLQAVAERIAFDWKF